MNSEEIKAFKCTKCGVAYSSKEYADRCCQPKHCEKCGVEIPRKSYYTLCENCLAEKEIEDEKKRFEKALHVKESEANPDRCEMMYHKDYGYDEGYFCDIEDLLNYCEENDIEKPKYCYGTRSRIISLDAEAMVEEACDELHENAFDNIDKSEIDELQEYIDEWCKKQTGTRTYEVDFGYAILIE